MQAYYSVFFVLRRFFFVVILLTLADYPSIGINLVLLLNIVMVAYLGLFEPHDNNSDRLLELRNETGF